jgi:hypothetical protein
MRRFRVVWLIPEESIWEGEDLADAMKRAGYGPEVAGAIFSVEEIAEPLGKADDTRDGGNTGKPDPKGFNP